jgi:hypothetical protein
VIQFQWNTHNRAFDWRTVTMDTYAQVAQDGSRNIADVTDTFGDLDEFKRNNKKLLTFVGANDQLIMPRGVLNYYRAMAAREGGGRVDFASLQKYFRLFRGPGVAHCAGGAGPQPQNLFGVLVDWVEKGVAPSSVLAQGPGTRTRPLCAYPQTAIYNGSGSTDDAANFRCGGNLETPSVVCADVLTTYKNEVNGPLDFAGSGVSSRQCR